MELSRVMEGDTKSEGYLDVLGKDRCALRSDTSHGSSRMSDTPKFNKIHMVDAINKS